MYSSKCFNILNIKFSTIRCYHKFFTSMAKPQVYITREINKEAVDLLKVHCDVTQWPGSAPVPRNEFLKHVRGKDGILCLLTDKIDKEILNAAGNNLKVIATMSVGFDHLDIPEIKKRGIKIGYTPDILTEATAELTVALLLTTSRRLFEAGAEASTGGWSSWSPFWMCGHGVVGSTIGIVGFGRIGQRVGSILKAFNPNRIIYYSRTEKTVEASKIGAVSVSFNELLSTSDFVIATCAWTVETHKLFNKDAFSRMKDSAIFINTSRGAIVDQDSLVDILEKKIIRGAGLDVTTPEPLPLNHPLFKLKNCVVLPHIGSATIETRNNMGLLTARNIIAALQNEKMPAEL